MLTLGLVSRCCSALRSVLRPIGEHPWVGVPEGSVDLQGRVQVRQEVIEDGYEPSLVPSDSVLGLVGDSEVIQDDPDLDLQFGNSRDSTFSDGLGCGDAQLLSGGLRNGVATFCGTDGVALPKAFRIRLSYFIWDVVGLGDFPAHQPESAALVVAGSGAEEVVRFRLDMAGGSGDQIPTNTAGFGCRSEPILPSQGVGALAGACGLAPMPKTYRVSQVSLVAVGADSFNQGFHQ